MEYSVPTTLFELTGKTALVTGSSRGLGRAIAEGLATAGAAVILNAINADRLDTTYRHFQTMGYNVSKSAFDVTDEVAIKKAFEQFDEQQTNVDILVNNAGIQFRKPMLELKTSDWQRVIDTNMTSAFVVGREAASRMIKRKAGKIINIGSLTSQLARPTVAPYAVSKGGIKMLTHAMAAEWGPAGIQSNAIAPGFMNTDLNEALTTNVEFDRWVKGRTPAGRWGDPDELAGVAIFLASAASNYVNGQMIFVDGGMTSVM